MDQKAKVDHRNWQKRTPLHGASENGHEKVSELLLEHKAGVDAENKYKWTPLHLASRTGKVKVTRVLLQHGAKADAQNDLGWTPLHMSSQKGHVEVVNLLLTHKPNAVNAQKADGETALHLAAYYGHLEVVKALLEKGAKPDIENKAEKCPEDMARDEGHQHVEQLLKDTAVVRRSRQEPVQEPRIPPTIPSTISSSSTSSTFQLIFDAALSDYTKQTGIDLVTHPSAQALQNCRSADAVLDLLQGKGRAKQFQVYRDGNRKLIDCLRQVVQVLHTVSGILNEAATSVSTAILLVLFGTHFNASDFRFHSNLQKQSSLVLMSSLQYEPPWSCSSKPFNELLFQAALGVSASYDALVDLFECVANFLDRLRIYSDIPFSPLMSRIITKIMVEILSVLSLATKQIKQGRLSMCFRNLDIPYSSC